MSPGWLFSQTGSEEGDAELAVYMIMLQLVSFYRLPLQDREKNCTSFHHHHLPRHTPTMLTTQRARGGADSDSALPAFTITLIGVLLV